MSLIALPPEIRLLIAMGETAATVDYEDRAGLDKPLTVRHARNRKPVRGERPALTLIFVGTEEQPTDLQRNSWETVWEMTVDMQIDLELATEDSELDATGLAQLSRVGASALDAFKDPDSAIAMLCDDIAKTDVEPSDRSNPDEGRLVWAVRVLYRVRSDDKNVLLARGADA